MYNEKWRGKECGNPTGVIHFLVDVMIIDTHVHIGGNVVNYQMTESDVIYAMNTYKIDKAIVSNADSVEADVCHNLLSSEVQTSQYNSLVRVVNFARDYPNRVYISVWVKPNTHQMTKPFFDLIDRNMDIVKAIKFHPFYSALRFDDNKVRPYLDVAQRLNIPVIVHSANDGFSNIAYIEKMAAEYVDVKFVLAHLGLESDHNEAIAACSRQQNLYADTAWVDTQSTKRFVAACGSERIFFGSDAPIDGPDTYAHNKVGQRSLYQEYFFDLPKEMSTLDYENIMFRNAQRIYGL